MTGRMIFNCQILSVGSLNPEEVEVIFTLEGKEFRGILRKVRA